MVYDPLGGMLRHIEQQLAQPPLPAVPPPPSPSVPVLASVLVPDGRLALRHHTGLDAARAAELVLIADEDDDDRGTEMLITTLSPAEARAFSRHLLHYAARADAARGAGGR